MPAHSIYYDIEECKITAGTYLHGVYILQDQASNAAKALADIGLAELYSQFKTLVKASEEGTEETVKRAATVLMERCMLEIHERNRLCRGFDRSESEIRETSKSLGFLLSYAVSMRYEYVTNLKIEAIISILNEGLIDADQLAQEVDAATGKPDEKFADQIRGASTFIRNVSLLKETITARITAQVYAGDDAFLYEKYRDLTALQARTTQLQQTVDATHRFYTEDGGNHTSVLTHIQRAFGTSSVPDSPKTTVLKQAKKLDEANGAVTKAVKSLVDQDTSIFNRSKTQPEAKAFMAKSKQLSSAVSSVNKALVESFGINQTAIQEEAKKMNALALMHINTLEQNRVFLTTLLADFKSRSTKTYNHIQNYLDDYQEMLKQMGGDVVCDQLLQGLTTYATNSEFDEQVRPKIRGLSKQQREEFVAEIVNSGNRRTEAKRRIKFCKKMTIFFFGALFSVAIFGITNAVKFHFQVGATVQAGLVFTMIGALVFALAMIAFSKRDSYLCTKKCQQLQKMQSSLLSVPPPKVEQALPSRPVKIADQEIKSRWQVFRNLVMKPEPEVVSGAASSVGSSQVSTAEPAAPYRASGRYDTEQESVLSGGHGGGRYNPGS